MNILMSSTSISSHLLSNYPFFDHSTIKPCLPSSRIPCFFSVTEHSCNRIKLNFLHFSYKHAVTKVLCSSENAHRETVASTSRKSELSEWKRWAVGIVLSVVLPSFGHKMGPLFLLKSRVDTAIERVEEVIEVAEEVAEATEELSEMVENKLPEDLLIKKGVDIVKNLSGNAVEEAKKAEELLDQVEDIEDELTGSLIGPGTEETEVVNQETSNKDLDPPVKT